MKPQTKGFLWGVVVTAGGLWLYHRAVGLPGGKKTTG